jgi:fucose 4-O-acetylase-like acetyltransferase
VLLLFIGFGGILYWRYDRNAVSPSWFVQCWANIGEQSLAIYFLQMVLIRVIASVIYHNNRFGDEWFVLLLAAVASTICITISQVCYRLRRFVPIGFVYGTLFS